MIPLIETSPVVFGSHKSFKNFVLEQEKSKTESEVEFKDLTVTENGLKVEGKEHPVRDLAMRQLLKTFQMPIRFYMDKSPTDMTIRDINRMKDEYTDDSVLKIFFQGNEIRGVADPNFRHVGYAELLKKIPIMQNFKTANYSDWGIRITTADPADLIKVKKDDIVEVGTDLVYSDTGWSVFVGRPFFNRLACMNGMVVREATDLISSFRTRFTHHMEKTEWLKAVRKSCKEITVDSKKMATIFKVMKDEPLEKLDSSDNFMRRVRTMVTAEVFNSDKELVKKIRDGEKEKCVLNLGVSIYFALAQITVLAKTLAFVERRRLETMAGGLVMMTLKAIKQGRIKTKLWR